MSTAFHPTPSPEQLTDGHFRATKMGRSRETWRRTVEKDPNIMGIRLDMASEQLQTEPDGEPLLSPHVPDGAEGLSE